MSTTPIGTIEKHFSNVEDPRTEYLIEHDLMEMIFIALCAVISSADNWVDVVNWAEGKVDWLREKGLKLENGIPAHDTFGRVFLLIDPEQFQAGFASWVKAVFQITKGQIIAIDGKQMNGSKSKKLGIKAICMVSAWAVENRIVLGQRKAEEKSNEIKAIPELLELLDLNGCLVTIDAAGCQKNNADIIIEQGGDYLFSLKGSQGNLHDDVIFLFDRAHENEFKGIDSDYAKTISQGHGRIEIRECWIIDDQKEIEFIRKVEEWNNLQTIIMIRSERQTDKETTTNDQYFISSKMSTAQSILEAKRSHWLVENDLHWSLDIGFNEDEHQLRGNGAANMAVVRHMALNLLKQEKTAKCGMAGKRRKAGWNTKYLERVLQLN
jgi:predicted transposase YbfD/YdcC